MSDITSAFIPVTVGCNSRFTGSCDRAASRKAISRKQKLLILRVPTGTIPTLNFKAFGFNLRAYNLLGGILNKNQI
ncbi:MAG TPA: hypothetical protein DDW76_33010 [Cyanobacteria bacterium UBA11369]|nr:hypothetical protein [Cyanobacteria bacterium UBA11371]HBE31815.1 hypothetical protein [Cyanobacteria bacterium UBA11368]HBE53442.1 hypothetical protein [Cyanobacteria bacterium UBA11369]